MSEAITNKLDALYQYKGLSEYGKVAYIDNGGVSMTSINTHFLYRNIIEPINLYSGLKSVHLEQYCAVVLPSHIDEHYLAQFSDKILSFVANGGVLLSFMSDYNGILPHSSGYIQSQVAIKDRVIKPSNTESARIIFENVREYDINYRRGVKGFFNRGYVDTSIIPHDVEWIMEDSEGRCVGYIDRSVGEGVILNTANADLLGYGIFDNTTARLIGINTLKWLELELKANPRLTELRKKSIGKDSSSALSKYARYKKGAKSFFDENIDKSKQNLSNKSLKNLIITGGSSFHRYFFSNKNAKYANVFSQRAHYLDIDSIDFAKFDYIVIASRLNQSHLVKHKQKFLDYLKSGGHIVSFGEVMEDYLPNILWRDYPVNFWWWILPNANMPLYALESGKKQELSTKKGLFSKINVSVAKWHYHGVFYPPENAEKILVNELDEAIIYKDKSFKGHLYVSSLDPEFHLGQGFMPTTEGFLDNFLAWVEEDIAESRGAK